MTRTDQIGRAMEAGRLLERNEILAQLASLVVVTGFGRERTAMAYEAIALVRDVIARRGKRRR